MNPISHLRVERLGGREGLLAEIRRLELDYERRVFGPDPFPDEQMRAARLQTHRLRDAAVRRGWEVPPPRRRPL